jgi:hypothetical protein
MLKKNHVRKENFGYGKVFRKWQVKMGLGN